MESSIKVLYHGSTQKIDGALTRHRGRNPDGNEAGNLFGIYATSDYPTAMVYTLDARRTTWTKSKVLLIDYSYDCIRVCFNHCCWNRKIGYIYVVRADNFIKINDFEYVSLTETPILERREITPEMIDGMVESGKLVIIQDSLPDSKIVQTGLRIVDAFVSFCALCSNFFYGLKRN